jgi:hypothetical protein
MTVRAWMWIKQHSIYCNGIFKLVPKWNKCIEVSGNCTEETVILWWNKWATLNILIILI